MNFSNLIRLQRAYDCNDDTLADYSCVDCVDNLEHARIGQGGFVHKSYYETLMADPTDASIWQTGITDGKIVIMPNLRGTYDGGTAVTSPGYGRVSLKTTGYNYTANIHDPVYADNYDFYASLVGNSGWHFAFLTETQGRITQVPVNVSPKDPITDSLDDAVEWQSDISWSAKFAPKPFTAPQAVFQCAA
jgi:hypothetical protein